MKSPAGIVFECVSLSAATRCRRAQEDNAPKRCPDLIFGEDQVWPITRANGHCRFADRTEYQRSVLGLAELDKSKAVSLRFIYDYHRGRIELQPGERVGTCVRIWLPLVNDSDATTTNDAPPEANFVTMTG